MENINFTEFDLKSPLSENDFLVGYDENGTNEFKTTVSDVLNVFSNYQSLSFNESNQKLRISFGNTISLSALGKKVNSVEKYENNDNYYYQIKASDSQKFLSFKTLYDFKFCICLTFVSH